MTVVCTAVRTTLDTAGSGALAGPLAAHVETCRSCSEVVMRFSTLTRDLQALPLDEFRAPSALGDAVMSSLRPVAVPDPAPKHGVIRPVTVVVATAAMATAAAGTAVIMHIRRARAA